VFGDGFFEGIADESEAKEATDGTCGLSSHALPVQVRVSREFTDARRKELICLRRTACDRPTLFEALLLSAVCLPLGTQPVVGNLDKAGALLRHEVNDCGVGMQSQGIEEFEIGCTGFSGHVPAH